jgi:hypothetical protein
VKTVSDIDKHWSFWRRVRLGSETDVYLDRFEIITTPWFGIKLHKIYRPDNQRDLHSHPWKFLSIILFGSYVEDTNDGPRVCRWFNWKNLTDFHSIRAVSRSPVWTLVFTGPKRQVWGFKTPSGWVAWYDYDKLDTP